MTKPDTKPTKAIFGGLLAGLSALGTALADSNLTALELVGVATAVVATAATVYGVTNAPTD
jgi:hypothetical protein